MTPLKSQLLGLLLGMSTAIGCIFYEKMVHAFSYVTIWMIVAVEMVLLLCASMFLFKPELSQDLQKIADNPRYIWYILIYMCTGITGFIWYKITKDQGVMVSSVYEMKYIVIMALIYIIFGDNKFTVNTAIGTVLALASIYFISRQS